MYIEALNKNTAKRLAEAVEQDDIIGPEQNGFRASRTCADNIFILNTVLEINASRKKLSHILFIDLKEAYDRVDRHILIRKLEQLKIPNTFVNFLKNYYFEDNISSATARHRTRKQYQKRGLRQGCNLSSILFIIYMSELGQRMRNSGVGVKLPDGTVVSILLFADNIILLLDAEEDLTTLKNIMEKWCWDFKMKMSPGKTNIITSIDNFLCLLKDIALDEEDIVEHVKSYKYLGINQYLTPNKTYKTKGELMIKKSENVPKHHIQSKLHGPRQSRGNVLPMEGSSYTRNALWHGSHSSMSKTTGGARTNPTKNWEKCTWSWDGNPYPYWWLNQN